MQGRAEENKRRDPVAVISNQRGQVAPENSVRIKAYYWLLPHFAAVARRRRMESLTRKLELKPGARVLDLGGAPSIWESVSVPLDITILNLPGGVASFELDSFRESIHKFHYVEGDACNVHQFPDRSFDLAFSNALSSMLALRRSRTHSRAKFCASANRTGCRRPRLGSQSKRIQVCHSTGSILKQPVHGYHKDRRRNFPPGGRNTSRKRGFSRDEGWLICSLTPALT